MANITTLYVYPEDCKDDKARRKFRIQQRKKNGPIRQRLGNKPINPLIEMEVAQILDTAPKLFKIADLDGINIPEVKEKEEDEEVSPDPTQLWTDILEEYKVHHMKVEHCKLKITENEEKHNKSQVTQWTKKLEQYSQIEKAFVESNPGLAQILSNMTVAF